MQNPLTVKIKKEILSDPADVREGSALSDRMGWYAPVSLPRWTVYVQAGLLGLVATSFFVFGMMVGSLTSRSDAQAGGNFDCRVVGDVAYRVNGDLRADAGAVVLVLPVKRKPDQRASGALVNPLEFQALDNVGIDRIHQLGGAVVRADEEGHFDVFIDGSSNERLEYFLMVISRQKQNSVEETMSKEQSAMIATFFMPVEGVVGDRAFQSLKFTARTDRVDIPEIEFE